MGYLTEIRKNRFFNLAISLFGLLILLTGCAVTGEEETLITVLPGSAVVTLGDTEPFSVTPAGTAVTWSVEGVLGGNEGTIVGTIDSAGVYTAPTDAEVAPEKVVVRATDASGTPDSAIAFLTTFKANKRVTTHYTPGTMKANTYSAGQRGILVKGYNIYIVWADNSIGGYNQAFFTMSKDVGGNFCKPIRIAGYDSADQFSPTLAVDNDNGNVYVVWEDYRDGDGDIYFAGFDDTDCNWDTTREWATSPFTLPVKVNTSRDTGVSKDSSPAVAVDSTGGIYVVWEDRLDSSENYPDIYFAKSTNQGATFPTYALVDSSGRRPAIAIGTSDIVYVVWEDIVQFPVQPTKIKIGAIEGNIPGGEAELPAVSGYNARYPSIAADPVCNTDVTCDVYVVWQRAEVANQGFTGETIKSYDIDMSIVDGELNIIKTTRSVPSGQTTGQYGGYAYPSVAADDNNIYIVWDEWRNGIKDIYFAKSSDGDVFTTNRIVNDDTSDDCNFLCHEKPSIAVLNEKAYVIWTDYRNPQLPTTVSPNDVFFAVEQ